MAAGVLPSAGPQQRAAAEAGLQLALRLGLQAASLLQALQASCLQCPAFSAADAVACCNDDCEILPS